MPQIRLAILTYSIHNLPMFKNLLIAGLAAIVAPVFAAEWMTDLDAARTRAAAENKAVLVDFTGSDWCTYCIRLRNNVFNKPEFDAYAADKFVLVEIDVPRDSSRVGGPENLVRNRTLCEEFKVSGFPTVLVMTANGSVVGGFVGCPDSVQNVAQQLDSALENAQRLEAANALSGVERAQALMAVYQNMPDEIKDSAAGLLSQIAELDPENTTGIQNLVRETEIMNQLAQDLRACGRNADRALELTNAAISQVSGSNLQMLYGLKQQILLTKIDAAFAAAETVEDVLAVKEIYNQILETLPAEEREAAAARINQLFANPEEVLEQIKSQNR